jgi:hypothetical protein
MKNLQKVMEAIARTKLKPHNPHTAFAELLEVIGEHSDQALLEYDEAVQHELGYRELENENAELRRRLRAIGISDKVAS